MKRITYFIFYIFFLGGCVEEFDLKLKEIGPRLVVDGLITNQNSPYYIRLTESKVGSFTYPDTVRYDNSVPIMDAVVIISDDTNQIDTLKLVDFNIEDYKYNYQLGYYKLVFNEFGKLTDTLFLEDPVQYNQRGFYKTNNLKGSPGHMYFMKIIYKDKIYTSSAYMPPVPEIDSLGYYLKKSEIVGKSDKYIPLLYFKEPQGIDNYYLIQLKNDASSRSGDESSIWQFSILSDTFLEPYVNGLNVSTGISPRGKDFYPVYFEGNIIYLALNSLTKESYNYYQNLLDQFENDGGAYKPTPASPPGNISNGGLGLFRASAVSVKRTVILRTSN